MTEKLYYSWNDFAADTETIAKAIEASGIKFKKVFAIPNGGLPLGVCLVNRLQPKPELLLTNPLTMPVMKNRSLVEETLIVDDITDKGNVLLPFQEAGFYIITIFRNPDSKVCPNHWARTKNDSWIIFPWETEESSGYDGTLEKMDAEQNPPS